MQDLLLKSSGLRSLKCSPALMTLRFDGVCCDTVTSAPLCHPGQEYNMMGRNRDGDAHAHHLGSSGAPSCDLSASSQGEAGH